MFAFGTYTFKKYEQGTNIIKLFERILSNYACLKDGCMLM